MLRLSVVVDRPGDEKADTKAKKLQAKADAEGQLQDTTSTMEDDKKYSEFPN